MSGQNFQHDNDVDGGLKRLAVEDSMASAFKDIHNEFISWENLENLIVSVLPDHTQVRFWFGEFSTWKGNGNSGKLPKDFPRYNQLRSEIMVGLNERINQCDPLTKVACMNYRDRMWRQFDDLNPKIFLKPILEHNGRMIQISGNPGTGKTDLAMLLVEEALRFDFVIITNIKTLDAMLVRMGDFIKPAKGEPIPNLYRTVRMSDLLYQCIQHRKAEKNVIVPWDEVSTFYNRQEAVYKKNIDMGKFIRLIRKFNVNIIFIEQIDANLSSIVNEMLVSKFHKESRKRLHYMTLPGENQYNEYLESVPKARLNFDTGDFAGFVNDVDFGDMFDKIAVEDTEKIDEIEKYLLNIILHNKSHAEKVQRIKRVRYIPKVRGKDGRFEPELKISHSNKDKDPVKRPAKRHKRKRGKPVEVVDHESDM